MRGGLFWADLLFRQEPWYCLGHGCGHRILANGMWCYGEEGIELGQGGGRGRREGRMTRGGSGSWDVAGGGE